MDRDWFGRTRRIRAEKMNCNSDFSNQNQAIDLNNNYIELDSNDAANSFDDHSANSSPTETSDSRTSIESEFHPSPFQHNRNVQTRDDIEFIVDTYLFIEKTRSLLLSFCW